MYACFIFIIFMLYSNMGVAAENGGIAAPGAPNGADNGVAADPGGVIKPDNGSNVKEGGQEQPDNAGQEGDNGKKMNELLRQMEKMGGEKGVSPEEAEAMKKRLSEMLESEGGMEVPAGPAESGEEDGAEEGPRNLPPGMPPAGKPATRGKTSADEEEGKSKDEIIARYRTLLYQKPFHQWAFDKLFRIYVEKNMVKNLLSEYRELSINNPDDDAYHIVYARVAEKLDDLSSAAEALSRIKEKSHDSLMLCARINRKLGKFAEAAVFLEQAAKGVEEPRILKEIYRELGIIYSASGDRSKAKDAWSKIKALAPDNYYNVKELAELYKANLYFDEALAEYRAIEKLAEGESSRLAEIYKAIGEIEEQRGNNEPAIGAYESGIALMARGNWLRLELERRIIAIYEKKGGLNQLEGKALEKAKANSQDAAGFEFLAAVYIAEGKIENAAATLRNATTLFPRDINLSKNLRDALAALKDSNGLVSEYRRIISENPEKFELYLELGRVFAADNRFEDAKREWNRALGKNLKDASFAAKLAGLYAQYNLIEEAVTMYERAIELAPKERTYSGFLGDLYMSTGDRKKAVAAWKRMTKSAPEDPAGWSDLADVLKANGFYSEALPSEDEAIRLAPDNYKYRFDRAGILILLGNTSEASALYRKVAAEAKEENYRDESIVMVINLAQKEKRLGSLIKEEEKKTDTISRMILALAYERTAKFVEAEKMYRGILKSEPNSRPALEAIARVLLRMQRYRDAADTYEKLILVNPGKSRAYYRALLEIVTVMGEQEKAVEIIRRMTDASPTNAAVFIEAGKAYFSLDKPEEAVEAFKQAVRLKNDEPEYRILLADALERMQKNDDALKILEETVYLTKDFKKRSLTIGRIYQILEQQGKLEEELEKLRHLLDNNPYDGQTRIFLAELLSCNMEFAEAIDLVARTLEMKKDDVILREMLARLYEEMEDPKAAAVEYEKTLELPDADKNRLFEKLGRAYLSAGEKEKASSAFRRLSDTKKSVGLLMENRLFDEATAVLTAALEKDPINDKYISYLASIYQEKGDLANATELYKKALDIKPAERDYMSALANLYIEAGDKAQAVVYAEKILSEAVKEEEESRKEDDDDDTSLYGGYGRRYYYGYWGGPPGLEAVYEAFHFFSERGLLDEFRKYYEEELRRQPSNVVLRLLGIEIIGERSNHGDLQLALIRELLRMEIIEKDLPIQYLLEGDIKDGMRMKLAALYNEDVPLRQKEKARLEEARKKGAQDAEQLIELAMIYDIEANKDGSLAVLAEAEKLAPKIPILVLAKARMHESRKEYDAARTLYKKYLAIAEEKQKSREKFRPYYRIEIKNMLPPNMKSLISGELTEFLVDILMDSPRERYSRYSDYSANLPGRDDVVVFLARLEKAAGNADEAKKYLAMLEPKNVKSAKSPNRAAYAYKEFEMEADEMRMRELALNQMRFRNKFIGTLSEMGYGRYGYGMESSFGELEEYYRKQGRFLDALEVMIETGGDIRPLISEQKLYEPAKKKYLDAISAWEKAPARERVNDDYRELVCRLAWLYNADKKFEEMEALYKSFLEKVPDDLDFLWSYEILLENRERYAEAAVVLENAVAIARDIEVERKTHPKIEPLRMNPPEPPRKQEEDSSYYDYRYRRNVYGGRRMYEEIAPRFSMQLAAVSAKMGDKKKAAQELKKYFLDTRKASYYSYGSSYQLRQFIERYELEDELAPVYRTLMILYPHDTEFQYMYGMYLEKKERYEEALNIYEKIVKAQRMGRGYGGGEFDDIAQRMDRLYKKVKRKTTTFEDLKKAVDENPKNVQANLRLTVFYFLNGELAKAVAQGENTSTLAPYMAELHSFLFRLYCMMGDESRAVAHLEKEIALTRDEYSKCKLYMAYGGMLYFSGLEDNALAVWKKMAVTNEYSSNRYLGNLLMSMGMYKLGSEYLEKAAKIESSYSRRSGSEMKLRVIAARILAGEFENAAAEFIEYLEKTSSADGSMNPDNPVFACAKKVGKLGNLEEMLWAKIKEKPDNYDWLGMLAQYYATQKNKEKLRDIYARMIALRPEQTAPLERLYWMSMSDKNYDEALKLSDRIFETEKKGGGSAFSSGGRSADYLKDIEKNYYMRRGNILGAMKKLKEACEEFKKTIEENKPETIMSYAHFLGSLNMDNEALQTMEEYFRKSKVKSEEDYRYYVGALVKLNRIEDAIKLFDNAGDQSGEGYSRYQWFSLWFELYQKIGRIPEFIQKMRAYYQQHPNEREVPQLILNAHQTLGDDNGALAFAREILEKDPASPENWMRLAQMCGEENSGTVDLYMKLLEKKPRDPSWIYSCLAQCYFKNLDNENGFKWLRKMCENSPEPEINFAGAIVARGFYNEGFMVLLPKWEERAEDLEYNQLICRVAFELENWSIALAALERFMMYDGCGVMPDGWRSPVLLIYEKTASLLNSNVIDAKPADFGALKRFYFQCIARNDLPAALRISDILIEKEPYNINNLLGRLWYAHKSGDKARAMDSAVRLNRVFENGGEDISRDHLKNFLLITARGENPLNILGEERRSDMSVNLNKYVGDMHFQNGDKTKAVSWWNRILYSCRDDYYYGDSAVSKLAEIYQEHDLYGEIRTLYDRSDIFQRYYYYRDSNNFKYARLLYKEGKKDEAIGEFVRILEDSGGDGYDRFNDEGRSYYRSYDGSGIYELVSMLRDEGHLDEYYKIAAGKMQDEKAPPFYAELYRMIMMNKRDRSGVPLYLKVKYREDENAFDALSDWLKYCVDMKDYKKVLEYSKRILEKMPEDRERYYLIMFVAAAKLGKNDEKAKYEEQYLTWNTINRDSRIEALFDVAMGEELYNEALSYAKILLKNEEKTGKDEEYAKFSARHKATLETLYKKLGLKGEIAAIEAEKEKNTKTWLEETMKRMKKNPHDENTYYYLGQSCLGREDFDNAFGYIKKAIDEGGRKDEFLESAGWCLFFKGEYEKALEFFVSAGEIENTNMALNWVAYRYDSGYSSYGRSYYGGGYYGGGYYGGGYYGGGYYGRGYYGGYSSYSYRDMRYRMSRGGRYYYPYNEYYGMYRSPSGLDFQYSNEQTRDYAVALCVLKTKGALKSAPFFVKARRGEGNSVLVMFADNILDSKPIDWKELEKILGERYKYYERFMDCERKK
jgi:tetratricopeptide (TPR) repeat protein